MKNVIYFNLGIGNFILLTPAIKLFWKMFSSNSEFKGIDIVIPVSKRSRYIKDICEQWDYISKVLIWPDDYIEFKKYDWMLNPWSEDSPVRTLLMSLVHPSNIIDINKVPWDYNKLHEVERNLLGITENYKAVVGDIKTECPIKPIKNSNRLWDRKENLGRKLIAFCNSCHNVPLWDKKRTPYEFFANLFFHLMKRYKDVDVVMIGGPEDVRFSYYMNNNIAYYRSHYFNAIDKYSITETAYILSKCDALVTTDTAAMHIASAVGTPTVTLFGPTNPNKNRAWPPNSNHAILQNIKACPYNALPCYPGNYWIQCNNNACMQDFKPYQVKKKLVSMGVL